MRNEENIPKGKLKGYMWECIIIRLLQENGFIELASVDNVRTKRDRENFIEMRGRGTWHQIDCLCDYSQFIPFINPIRLLGEVKFHRNAVNKAQVSEYIGTIKDIQENYFAPVAGNRSMPRYTELGVFFSANGFQREAERLAFAHNIKTISHKNVAPLLIPKELVENLANNYISASNCISSGNQKDFIRIFRDVISGNPQSIQLFEQRFKPADGFDRIASDLSESLNHIRSNFVASSRGGGLLHFVGNELFPDELFHTTDTQHCRVYFERVPPGRQFYLILTEDIHQRRYYFSPPTSLSQAAFFGNSQALDEKQRIFRTIHVSRNIDGLTRTLTLKLDPGWLRGMYRNSHR